PFFTTKQETGTGLGLWLTKNIVEKHGGTISVSSSNIGRTGKGFVLNLPQCDIPSSQATAAPLTHPVLPAWGNQPCQPNVPIQSAMALPISCGESSWRKWSPATFTSVCAGNLLAKSRFAPPARSKPGSAFTNSLGTSLVASQSA